MSVEGNTAPETTDTQIPSETETTDTQITSAPETTDTQIPSETETTDTQIASEAETTAPQNAPEAETTTPQITSETVTSDPETTSETVTTESEEKVSEPSVESTSSVPPSVNTPDTSTTQPDNQTESSEPSENPNKRAGDELEPEEKSKKAKTENVMVIKMLCPFWCAGAVIGTKGAYIRQLKEETGCLIRITRNHENFPMTSERVVSMRGEVESIKQAVQSIQKKIRDDKPPPNAPSKDNSKRKSCLKLVVGVSSAGRIIGKGGEQTKKLQTLHGVHVDVMKTVNLPPGLNESVVTISGEDVARVDACMADILALVSEDKRANLNYNVDYSSFADNRAGGGRQSSGWGGAGGFPGPQPHFYPGPWGGNRQPFGQNFRGQHARPGNFNRR